MTARCCALDEKGRRCRRDAVRVHKLHLEGELYDYPNWLVAALCLKHETLWVSASFRRKGRRVA